MINKLASSFRETVSGSPEGRPPWVKLIEEGNDLGLFGSDSAVWEVHGSVSTLIGGIRALLLQAAHPAALSGVKSHSRYETDLFGRLQGTSRWLTITTFGSKELIEKEAARVNAMHSKVSGNYQTKEKSTSDYKASDPRFLLWVHCAFTESFLEAHLICKYPLRNSPDDYVSQWSSSAKPLGLSNAPKSVQELKSEIDRFMREELACTAETEEVIRFILNPPFGTIARFFYKALAKTAVRSLTKSERELLKLKMPSKVWQYLALFNLWVLRKALGPYSPAQQAALNRNKRLAGGDERI